jgi:hypothetical protein
MFSVPITVQYGRNSDMKLLSTNAQETEEYKTKMVDNEQKHFNQDSADIPGLFQESRA